MKHDFEERRQKRIDGARGRAAKNKQEAEILYRSAKNMAGAIPMGQPILVGHHSEGRDRRYRQKINDTFGKSFEKQDKAAYYEQKAETIEENDAIFSDDPNALQKLTDKLNGLKTVQEFMKAANKCLKKDDKEAFLKLEMGTEALWQQLNVSDRLHGKGFPHYKLTNNGANIRRIEQRIAALQRQEVRPAVDKTVKGIRIFENTEANRLQVIFSDKPAEPVRKTLKANGFRWSPTENAWQRHLSRQSLYTAEQIINGLSD
jgi:hypothetical protein